MSHIDKITYYALRTVDTMARDDHAGYVALHKEIEASKYDGFHVAQTLASMVLAQFQTNPNWRANLDALLEQGRVFNELNLPDEDDENMFLKGE